MTPAAAYLASVLAALPTLTPATREQLADLALTGEREHPVRPRPGELAAARAAVLALFGEAVP